MTFAGRLEVECGQCGKKHAVKTLAAALRCCSTLSGVWRLIVAVHDPETGARWFAVTRGTVVRIYTHEGRLAPSSIPKRTP